MIMARNEDGTYSQVGFVKDNAGIDTEYIYDKDGDIVFEKGFTRETSGTVPLTINGIGKDLKTWHITGNTVQDGTPTPDTPQEVKAVGDRTGNLFDYSTITTGYRIVWATGADYADNTAMMSDYIKVKNTTYRCSNKAMIICYDSNKNYLGALNKSMVVEKEVGIFYDMFTINDNKCKFIKLLTYQGFVIGNKTMLNEGSTALPYEPYGYKIPVVTRGKNLLKLKEVNLTTRGVAVSVKNNSITVKGTAKSNGGRTDYLSESFVLQPGTYFISGNVVNSLVYCLTDMSNGKAVVAFSSTSEFTLAEKIEVAFGLNVISGVSYDATVNVMLNEGDKKLPYEPYHEPITTPIYLPTPLYSGEVMRSDGTITRSDGTTETFTAPQIPTLNGTTVIDVDTAVKPESMTIKYRR